MQATAPTRGTGWAGQRSACNNMQCGDASYAIAVVTFGPGGPRAGLADRAAPRRCPPLRERMRRRPRAPTPGPQPDWRHPLRVKSESLATSPGHFSGRRVASEHAHAPRTRAHARARTHARTYRHTYTHTHTHTHTHTRPAGPAGARGVCDGDAGGGRQHAGPHRRLHPGPRPPARLSPFRYSIARTAVFAQVGVVFAQGGRD